MKVQNYLKKEIKNSKIDQIISLIKLQIGIIKILQIFLNEENNKEKKEIKLTKDNYDKQINEILEECDKINMSIYPKEIEENKNIHQKELYKLMPVIGSYKNCKILEGEEYIKKSVILL